MRIRLAVLTFVVAAGMGGLAFAHGGHKHVMGTTTAVDATHAEVKTVDGKTVSVALTPETKYFKDKAAATAADLAVGLRVVIDAETKDGALEAAEVKIGVAAAPTHD